MRNERGSIPLVMVVVVVLSITILSLTQLLLGEKTTAQSITESQANDFYQEDMVFEIATNLTLQTIKDKEWISEIQGEKYINTEDLLNIENILNQESLPYENNDLRVILSNLYAENVTESCDAVYELITSNEQGEFLGYRCNNQPTDVEFTLTIKEESNSHSYIVRIENIYPKTGSKAEKIYLDTNRVTVTESY